MLRVCAAGEFLGSLVQIEEGLRKLNINEEVGDKEARWGWVGGGYDPVTNMSSPVGSLG
jgi:hypothetical protein